MTHKYFIFHLLYLSLKQNIFSHTISKMFNILSISSDVPSEENESQDFPIRKYEYHNWPACTQIPIFIMPNPLVRTLGRSSAVPTNRS